MQSGLLKIRPQRKDNSFLHSYGATVFDTKGLPTSFSIYNGEPIPDQDALDTRFSPALPPLPFGCTGESTSFICGVEDNALYNPMFTYLNTPPGTFGVGRDIRASLESSIDTGLQNSSGNVGGKRTALFNVYGSRAIDDFDAARIAIWINQNERRAVSVGSYWYPEFESVLSNNILPIPSFNVSQATLHNYIITGWVDIGGTPYLECISWQGMKYGKEGIVYMSRSLYNALMEQPWTGAFTVTKTSGAGAIPIGYTAIIDHLVYMIRQLFHV